MTPIKKTDIIIKIKYMTITRKNVITAKYLLLKNQLEQYLPNTFYPWSIGELDISYILFYFNLYFPKNKEKNYLETLETILEPYEISDSHKNAVKILIIDFVIFINNI
jgi:hypothetical protein